MKGEKEEQLHNEDYLKYIKIKNQNLKTYMMNHVIT